MNIHFPSEKLILLDFSSPRGVTTLGCEFHSQAGLANARRQIAVPFLSFFNVYENKLQLPRASWMRPQYSDMMTHDHNMYEKFAEHI